MKAKDKAKELVDKFIPHTRVFDERFGWEDYIDEAKQCALIAVDEIIEILWHTHKNEIEYRYWQEVKQEIIKL